MIIGKATAGLGRNVEYFKSKWYNIKYTLDKRGRKTTKKGTKILVDPKDLPPKSSAIVTVECEDCNKKRKIQYATLFAKSCRYSKTGETLCSNCANKRMSGKNSGVYKHWNIRYPEYRCNAKKRGIDFELTVWEFEDITEKPCHYCWGNSKDRNIKSRGNGIDRKDSSIGYLVNNCVPCCATCNFIKNSMPYNDFISYLRKLYHHTKNYEIQE